MFTLTALLAIIAWQLIAPIVLIAWVLKKPSNAAFDTLLRILTAWAVLMYIFYVGRWDVTSYYMRYVFLLALCIASLISLYRTRSLPLLAPRFFNLAGSLVNFFILITFGWLLKQVFQGFLPDGQAINLRFPLRAGFVTHGGASQLINYHYADKGAQRYALDIVSLNVAGMRARELFPKELTDYAIFGDTVFSPCDGVILKVQDGLPNQPIGASDEARPAGNYIAIVQGDVTILLAHLMPGSIMAQESDSVKCGEPLARVGNSGNTSNPHLHMHAIKGNDATQLFSGKGIPILLGGRFLTRNDVW